MKTGDNLYRRRLRAEPGQRRLRSCVALQPTPQGTKRRFRLTTNNRMEIIAVIKGLQALNEPCQVSLHSDSQYVVRAINEGWVKRWQAKGWMRNRKEPAKNVDLGKSCCPCWRNTTLSSSG